MGEESGRTRPLAGILGVLREAGEDQANRQRRPVVLFVWGQGVAGDPLDQPMHADGLTGDRYQGVSA